MTSISARSLPAALGYGVALSAGMFAFDFTGGSLFGTSKDKDVDEFDRRTKLRKAFQSPGEETVAELGEGRGMYPSHFHALSFQVLSVSTNLHMTNLTF